MGGMGTSQGREKPRKTRENSGKVGRSGARRVTILFGFIIFLFLILYFDWLIVCFSIYFLCLCVFWGFINWFLYKLRYCHNRMMIFFYSEIKRLSGFYLFWLYLLLKRNFFNYFFQRLPVIKMTNSYIN